MSSCLWRYKHYAQLTVHDISKHKVSYCLGVCSCLVALQQSACRGDDDDPLGRLSPSWRVQMAVFVFALAQTTLSVAQLVRACVMDPRVI